MKLWKFINNSPHFYRLKVGNRYVVKAQRLRQAYCGRLAGFCLGSISICVMPHEVLEL